jgi:outer membrane protein TolC
MNNLLGRDLATEFTVRPVAEVMNWELDLAGSRARALEQRPELREARLKVEQAEGDRRMKKAEYIPDVSLGFYYLSPFNIELLPKNVAAVGVLVSWDVFDWGRKRHELESKGHTVAQAKNGVDETASMIMIEVGMHFRKLEEARQQLRAADLAREAAQEKVRVAVNRVEQNAALVKDALQMRASLAEVTYKYQETLLSFWTARADLEKAIGEK